MSNTSSDTILENFCKLINLETRKIETSDAFRLMNQERIDTQLEISNIKSPADLWLATKGLLGLNIEHAGFINQELERSGLKPKNQTQEEWILDIISSIQPGTEQSIETMELLLAHIIRGFLINRTFHDFFTNHFNKIHTFYEKKIANFENSLEKSLIKIREEMKNLENKWKKKLKNNGKDFLEEQENNHKKEVQKLNTKIVTLERQIQLYKTKLQESFENGKKNDNEELTNMPKIINFKDEENTDPSDLNSATNESFSDQKPSDAEEIVSESNIEKESSPKKKPKMRKKKGELIIIDKPVSKKRGKKGKSKTSTNSGSGVLEANLTGISKIMMETSNISGNAFESDILDYLKYREFFKHFIEILPWLESKKKYVKDNPEFFANLLNTAYNLIRNRESIKYSEEQSWVCNPEPFPMTFPTNNKFWLKIRTLGKEKEKEEKTKKNNIKNQDEIKIDQLEDTRMTTEDIGDDEDVEEEDFINEENQKFRFLKYNEMTNKVKGILLNLGNYLRIQIEKNVEAIKSYDLKKKNNNDTDPYLKAKDLKNSMKNLVSNFKEQEFFVKSMILIYRFLIQIECLEENEFEYYKTEIERFLCMECKGHFLNFNLLLKEWNEKLGPLKY